MRAPLIKQLLGYYSLPRLSSAGQDQCVPEPETSSLKAKPGVEGIPQLSSSLAGYVSQVTCLKPKSCCTDCEKVKCDEGGGQQKLKMHGDELTSLMEGGGVSHILSPRYSFVVRARVAGVAACKQAGIPLIMSAQEAREGCPQGTAAHEYLQGAG